MDEVLAAGRALRSEDAERAVIEAAAGGDARAFADLYDRYLERVYRYVFNWVSRRADAEDLTQQVFLQAWRAIARYRHTGASFIAWLLTIAHNVVMSFFRRNKEMTSLDFEPASETRWGNPEAVALAKYDRLAVQRAILRLKPEQQQVIVMRFSEHLEYSDIAAALGKSEGNIRVIQHRALAGMRRLLSPEVNV